MTLEIEDFVVQVSKFSQALLWRKNIDFNETNDRKEDSVFL